MQYEDDYMQKIYKTLLCSFADKILKKEHEECINEIPTSKWKSLDNLDKVVSE